MPPAILARDEVVDRLMLVIRRFGYDGASLTELSKATGLGKSSLYHHFPDGKDDMVRAVLDHLATTFKANVFDPLRGPGAPRKRLDAMVKAVDEFYARGHESCVLAQLVLGSTRGRFRAPLKAIFTDWMDAITTAVTDAGIPRAVARRRAEDAVLRIEGALVLTGGMDDDRIWRRVLQPMPDDLLAPVPSR